MAELPCSSRLMFLYFVVVKKSKVCRLSVSTVGGYLLVVCTAGQYLILSSAVLSANSHKSHSFSITSSHIDCRCPYIVNFKRCTKSSCKQLIKYTTSVPIPCVNCECMSTESCLHCARCRQQLKDDATSCANCHCTTPTISIKCCTKCKWLKESTSSHSKSCVHCECPHTESFKVLYKVHTYESIYS